MYMYDIVSGRKTTLNSTEVAKPNPSAEYFGKTKLRPTSSVKHFLC